MPVTKLDHLVLTVRSLDATCDFYERVLGMRAITFDGGRRALNFGTSKINLHETGREFEPKADRPTPGSADLCFTTDAASAEIARHLAACGVPVLEGPVPRAGAAGPMVSFYVRDPDLNLIEIATYGESRSGR